MKTHKSQLYDKIHSIIDMYNDRMVRGIFEYDIKLNPEIILNVLKRFCEASPIMHSAFHRGIFRHYWIEQSCEASDFITIKQTENINEEAYMFITEALPMNGKVQFKVGIFTNGERSTLAFITNHMYMDGGDLKSFMHSLCKAYNACEQGKDFSGFLKSGSRSHKTVYNSLSYKNRIKAKLLYSNPTPKNTKIFPLSASENKDRSFIVTRNISADKFLLIKELGKRSDATVNDMILTAYFMSLHELGGFNENEALTVSGAIDLRRYIKNSHLTGITNHSAYLPYTLKRIDKNFENNLKEITALSKKFKEDPFAGLYGLPLLNFGFSFFPAFVADRLVKRFYNNPNIAISNIGILPEDFYAINANTPTSAFITGTVKYNPGIMLSLTTYKNKITLSMCCKGNEKDKSKLQKLLMLIEQKLADAIEYHPEN